MRENLINEAAISKSPVGTEKKPLPKGWKWVRLGDVCYQDKKIIEPTSVVAKKLPYLSLEHIQSETGQILKEPDEPLSDFGKSTTFLFDNQHILYSKLRPYLNKVALPDFIGRCTTELIPILPSEKTTREFIAWVLRRKEVVELAMQNKTGSRMPRADLESLFAMEIPLPPLHEQKRIAAILAEQLAAVEQARKAAQEQLEAAKALPAAYLREVFQGEKAKKWERKKLGEVCYVNPRRNNFKERANDTPTTFVPMSAIDEYKGEIVRPEVKPYQEVKKGYTFFTSFDVLFAKITPCMENGKHAVACHLIDNIGFGSTEFHVLRPSERIISNWVHYFIRQPFILRAATTHFTGAVGQQRVPEKFLTELEIPLPSLAEQKRIAGILTEQLTVVEGVRKVILEQIEIINQLPSSLLQRAFNGEL